MSDHSGQKEWEKGEVSVMTNKLLLKSGIKRSIMALEVGVVRIERGDELPCWSPEGPCAGRVKTWLKS